MKFRKLLMVMAMCLSMMFVLTGCSKEDIEFVSMFKDYYQDLEVSEGSGKIDFKFYNVPSTGDELFDSMLKDCTILYTTKMDVNKNLAEITLRLNTEEGPYTTIIMNNNDMYVRVKDLAEIIAGTGSRQYAISESNKILEKEWVKFDLTEMYGEGFGTLDENLKSAEDMIDCLVKVLSSFASDTDSIVSKDGNKYVIEMSGTDIINASCDFVMDVAENMNKVSEDEALSELVKIFIDNFVNSYNKEVGVDEISDISLDEFLADWNSNKDEYISELSSIIAVMKTMLPNYIGENTYFKESFEKVSEGTYSIEEAMRLDLNIEDLKFDVEFIENMNVKAVDSVEIAIPTDFVEYEYESVIEPDMTEKMAIPSDVTIYLNGEVVNLEGYNVDGNNYFKLRDLAYVLNDTDKTFEVSYDENTADISLVPGSKYTAVGGELNIDANRQYEKAISTFSNIYLDGNLADLEAYLVKNNNYFKLRDLGKLFNFGVTWDGETRTIYLDTSAEYVEE